MAKPERKPNAYYVFQAGWIAHDACLHGDRRRRTAEEAWELFRKSNKHLTGESE